MAQINPYIENQIMTAPPNDLVTYIFDAAITSCHRKDRKRALEAMDVLIRSLKTEKYKEIGLTLYSAYQTIIAYFFRDDWDEAEQWLWVMRDMWKQVI
ncbi:hypothetical protein KAJ27_03185 [bacterium]|nr:hypothetical protein [bacterium]